MSFREKSAWAMGLVLILMGFVYAQSVLSASSITDGTAPPNIALISSLTILLVAGAVISNTVLAVIDPSDSSASEDERDRLVLWRAGNIAGYVLGFGVVAGLWHYFVLRDGNMLFHIVVASLIFGQIAEYALSIWYYRRGV